MKRIAAVFIVALLASLPACHCPGPLPPPHYQGIDPEQPASPWSPPSTVGPQRMGASLLYPGGVNARSVDQVSRVSYALRGQGLIAESFNRQGGGSSGVTVSGQAAFHGVGLLAGDVITKAVVIIGAAGSGVTLSKVGLYDSAGNRLAVSADQGVSWETIGKKEISFISPYTIPVSGWYYLAFIVTATTTQPSMLRNATILYNQAIGTGSVPYGSMSGQTDLPVSATISPNLAGNAYWMGAF